MEGKVLHEFDCGGYFVNNTFKFDGEQRDILSSEDRNIICKIYCGNGNSMGEIVDIANSYVQGRACLNKLKRIDLVKRLCWTVSLDIDRLSQIEALNRGMRVDHAKYSIERALETIRKSLNDYPTKFQPKTDHNRSTTYIESIPVGVCAVILPPDLPAAHALEKISIAFISGNALIINPAEQTPLSTLYIASLVKETGFPPGALAVMTSRNRVTSRLLAKNPLVNQITFSGSTTKIGKIFYDDLMTSKRIFLEHVPKSVLIVEDGSDSSGPHLALSMMCKRFHTNSPKLSLIFLRNNHRSNQYTFIENCTRLSDEKKKCSRYGFERLVDKNEATEFKSLFDLALSEEAYDSRNRSSSFDQTREPIYRQPAFFDNVRPTMSIYNQELVGQMVLIIRYNDNLELSNTINARPYDQSIFFQAYSTDRQKNNLFDKLKVKYIFDSRVMEQPLKDRPRNSSWTNSDLSIFPPGMPENWPQYNQFRMVTNKSLNKSLISELSYDGFNLEFYNLGISHGNIGICESQGEDTPNNPLDDGEVSVSERKSSKIVSHGDDTDLLFINNEFIPSKFGTRYKLIYPRLTRWIQDGHEKDIKEAINASSKVLENESKWSRNLTRRIKVLKEFLKLIENTRYSLNTIGDSIDTVRSVMHSYCQSVEQNTTLDRIKIGNEWFISTKRLHPIGICAVILPPHCTAAYAIEKIFLNLIAGNVLIIKPALNDPRSTLYLAQLSLEAGIPAGVLHVVTGSGETIPNALVEHPLVKKVTFVGSEAEDNLRLCLPKMNSDEKKIYLEFDRRCSFIVCEDSDIDDAVKSSQSLLLDQYHTYPFKLIAIHVKDEVYDEFVRKSVELVKSRKRPMSGLFYIAHMFDKSRVENFLNFVKLSTEEGAKLEQGGCRVGGDSYDVEPAILTQLTDVMECTKSDPPGPILMIFKFDDLDHLIGNLNMRHDIYGSVIYSNNKETISNLTGRLTGIKHFFTNGAPTAEDRPIGEMFNSTRDYRYFYEDISSQTMVSSIVEKSDSDPGSFKYREKVFYGIKDEDDSEPVQ